MATLVAWCKQAGKRRFVRFGLPFLVCIVGGSFVLKQFTTIRYDFRKSKKITEKEAEKYGFKVKKDGAKSVEEIYEETQNMDIDTWNNIRGPRPWEDSKTVQDLQRQAVTKT